MIFVIVILLSPGKQQLLVAKGKLYQSEITFQA